MQGTHQLSGFCKLFRLFAILAVLSFALSSRVQSQDQTLTGVAVGPNNAPVGQLLLELRTEESVTFYAVTGEDGRFTIKVPGNLVTSNMQLVWDPTGPREGSSAVAASDLASGRQVLARLAPSDVGPPPQLRFNYHTASGYDASILLTGFVPPQIRDSALYADSKMLIVSTPAFEYGAKILERFGSRYVDDYLSLDDSLANRPDLAAEEDESSGYFRIDTKHYLLSAYGDERTIRDRYRTLWNGDPRTLTVPIPDTTAVRALVEDHRLPSAFRYQLWSVWNDEKELSMPPPTMTRDLVVDDILRYNQRKATNSALSRRAPAFLDDGFSAFGSVDVLEPLLALFPDGNIPPGVAEVRLNYQPAGCGGFGFWFETHPPTLSVEVLVIENVTGGNLSLGNFVGGLESNGSERELRAPLYPQRILRPNEILIVPLAVVLNKSSPSAEILYTERINDEMDELGLEPMDDSDRAKLAAMPADRLVPVYIPATVSNPLALPVPLKEQGIGPINGTMFACRAQSVIETWDRERTSSLVSHPPITVGPTLTVDGVEIDGAEAPVRLASRTFSSVTGSLEGGSCPFLLIQDPQTGVWINKGPVIVGAVGPKATMTETVVLPPGVTRVRILEHEMETSFLYDVSFLPADDAHVGKFAVTPASLDSLRLDHGDWVEFEADANAFSAAGGRLALRITGYYEPY